MRRHTRTRRFFPTSSYGHAKPVAIVAGRIFERGCTFVNFSAISISEPVRSLIHLGARQTNAPLIAIPLHSSIDMSICINMDQASRLFAIGQTPSRTDHQSLKSNCRKRRQTRDVPFHN